MNRARMVKPNDHSSDGEPTDQTVRKHSRTSSSDQAKIPASYGGTVIKSIEEPIAPTSPSKSKHGTSERPQSKRRKSSTSSKHKSRPAYSRKYSTPPSRPVSPSGYPRLLDPDMVIPEIDLNQTNNYMLQVDTAPQEPDIWDDPETDYFSTIEGPAGKHNRGKSRRQISQSLNNTNSLNAILATNKKGLNQISEEAEREFNLPPTPGGFAA